MSSEAIHKLSEERKKWVEASRENDFEDGIKRLLTDLYPDNAHFIYELLQNAEDAEASEVRFILNSDSVEFEHDGNRLFSIEDVKSITSIGITTKKDDHTSIGKFGVGFKAVFAYTSTPEIKSGEYHFRIRDLVVPDTEGLFPKAMDENRTHFFFPFDNPEKSPEKAYAEIEKNLRQLDEGALLFLKNIKKVEYRLPDSKSGSLERKEQDGDRIEISVRCPENSTPDSFQYLRFEKVVEVMDENEGDLKSCRIAAAFGMERDKEQKWKIKQLDKGQVCIYFPAEKETSKLRFHLHAPFASTVARDSVRDCPTNDELRDHLADLVAESMTAIRNKELLDVSFLAVLPNDRDSLSPFYRLIQDKLVEVFKNEKLTPMKYGGHAAASGIYRGSRQLSELLKDEDLATILEEQKSLPLWAANAPQRNQREDNYLTLLGIPEWDEEDLVGQLSEKPELIETWLKNKTNEWHQAFYALLGDFLSKPRQSCLYKIRNLPIARISDGTYKKGRDCYFPTDDSDNDDIFPRVSKAVYSSGKDQNLQEKAHHFLERIGVRQVQETDHVKEILKQRYVKGALCEENHMEDLERFIALLESDPDRADLFQDFHIFKINKNLNGQSWWGTPGIVYLDSPYLDTGLNAHFDTLGEQACKWALSPIYKKYGIDAERLGKFAKLVGAQTELEVEKQTIPYSHPEYSYLKSAPGDRRGDWVDCDYTISEFKILLQKTDIDKARLIWRTMNSLDDSCLKARYRKSRSGGFHYGVSSLVHDLREGEWVPQENGDSYSFVRPRDALIECLPDGFKYDTGKKWLIAIEFGEGAKKKRDEQTRSRLKEITRTSQAKNLGFDSFQEAEKMAEVACILKKRGKSPDELLKEQLRYTERRTQTEFPIRKLEKPDRRLERLTDQLHDAPTKGYERPRKSVQITEATIYTRTWLREQYTNTTGQMCCQICQEEMPFKKPDGQYYFEAVEALSVDYLPKEHEAQFLALCPECAARYKVFVKNDEGAMRGVHGFLKNADDLEIPLKLGKWGTSLRFVETHRQFIKTILQENSFPQ